jgi:RHS repeat-associated protein
MNRRIKGISSLLLSAITIATAGRAAEAQTAEYDVGAPVSSVTLPVERGFVNLVNGNLHIEIPFATYGGRGRLSTSLRMVYDSMIWHGVATGSGSSQWLPTNVPNSMGGWRFVSSLPGGLNGGAPITTLCGSGYYAATQYGPFFLTTLDGTVHTFAVDTYFNPSPEPICANSNIPDMPSASGYAMDGSGYYLEVTSYDQMVVYDRNGTQIYSGSGTSQQIDTNGNYNDLTHDDLGRVIAPIKSTSPDGTTTYYDVLTVGGQTERYSVTQETIQYNTNFLSNSVGSDVPGSMTVVQSIGLPDGSSYQFGYETNYGELNSITLPHGGTITYAYQSGLNGTRAGEAVPSRWVSSHTGSNGTTTFSIIPSNCPGGNLGNLGPCPVQHNYVTRNGVTTDYHFTLQGDSGYLNDFIYYHTGGQNSPVARTVAKTYNLDEPCPNTICGTVGGYLWPNLASEADVFNDTLLTKYTSYQYTNPAIGIPTTVQQWDYYTSSAGSSPAFGPTGPPSRQTVTQLQSNANGVFLPHVVTVSDSSGQLAQTTYSYDDPGHIASPSVTPPNNCTTTPPACPVGVTLNPGNLTNVKRLLNTNNTEVSTDFFYDSAGALQYSVDPLQNYTYFTYDPTDTFVTKITLPPTNGVQHILQATYDPSTGQVLTQTDQNNQVTSYVYDSLGRPYTVTTPSGELTKTTYPSPNETDIDDMQSSGVHVQSTVVTDSFARPSQQTVAGISTETTYDSWGRPYCTFTPHATTSSSATDGSTCKTAYDEFDRVQTIQRPDGNTVGLSYTDNVVTTTDEVGHVHKNTYNAFGDLSSVIEQDDQGALDWETDYQYDGLDRLGRIDQKGASTNPSDWRTRTFVYDSLSRLSSQTTPEAGLLTFNTYDLNGNLQLMTDARNQTVQYQYDALNRLTHKILQNGSTYQYNYDAQDSSGDPFGIGLLTSTQSGSNVGAYFTHDNSGNIASEKYCLPSDCSYTQAVQAKYDYHGNVVSITYPDGRTIVPSYDPLDRPVSEKYTAWNGNPTNVSYFANPAYYPAGELNAATYGNGVQVSAGFNSRQSITSLAYSLNSQPLWSKAYTWDLNAANLLNVTDNISGNVRSFTYDNVNRLRSAQDSIQGNATPGTAGRGSATISGTEGSHTSCPTGRPPCSVSWDKGTVSISVNGIVASVSYGQGSTASSLASSLAAALNAGNSSVTASASGATISMVSNTAGAATNYSLLASSSSSAGSTADFQITASAPTLTGGSNPTVGGMSDTYTLDAWGNLQEQGTFNFLQPANGANQISATGYGYDLAGNQTSDGAGNTYTYDADGKTSGSNGAVYTRDPFGQRVRKDVGSTATEYYYFGTQLLATRDPSSGQWTDYVYVGSHLIAEHPGTETAAPIYRIGDHLDSLAQNTDAAGNILGANDFSPYGDLVSSSAPDRLLFTQHERDTENFTDSTLYRQYASVQGRWLSPDPYDGSYDLTDPQSLNRYAYLSGRPLASVDSLGLLQDGGFPGDSGGGGWGSLPSFPDIWSFFGGGGGAPKQPHPNVETTYGNPYDDDGSIVFPEYVSGSDPGSFGESLGIPTGIPQGNWGIGLALGLPLAGCEFGACGSGGLDFTQPGQTDQTNSNGPQYPYLPPWLAGNRNKQGRPPGRTTPRNIPTEDPGAEPKLGPFNEPPPTNSGRFWYTLMQLLRIIDNNINPPVIPVIVDPCVIDPTQPYCHKPYNGPV